MSRSVLLRETDDGRQRVLLEIGCPEYVAIPPEVTPQGDVDAELGADDISDAALAVVLGQLQLVPGWSL